MTVLTLLQILVALSFLQLAKAVLKCKVSDQPSLPKPQPILSRFVTVNYSTPDSVGQLLVYLGSLEECAQFCVQISEADILNCTGFKYESLGRCIVQTSYGCKQTNNIVQHNYVLKDYASQCANNTSASIVPSMSRGPTVKSTITTLTSKQDTSSILVINVTVILLDIRWEDSLMNTSSDAFYDLTNSIKYNVSHLYINNSILRDTSIYAFSNSSLQVHAVLRISYNDTATMSDFNVLYTALYRKHSIHHIRVSTIWDNLPGKPPTNVAHSNSSNGTVVISWTHAYSNVQVETLGYRVVFWNGNSSEALVTGYRIQHVKLKGIKNLSNYSVTVTSVTHRGFGINSLPIMIKTTAKVVRPSYINITVILEEENWMNELGNNTHPANILLRTRLKNSISSVYSNHSHLEGIEVFSLRKHVINGSESFVQAKVKISYEKTQDLLPVYRALYVTNRFNNMNISLVQDNIPGKPVTNISWKSTDSQSITVSWSQSLSIQCGYIVFYRVNSTVELYNTSTTFTNTTVSGLLPLTHYVIWIQSITTSGLGLPSDVISGVTLERMLAVNITMILHTMPWDSNLLNSSSELYHNVTDVIRLNIEMLHVNNTQLKEIKILHFTNHTNITEVHIAIVYGHYVKSAELNKLHTAIYSDRLIYRLTVQPLTDTIPGKSPKNIITTVNSTTSILLTWDQVPQDLEIPILRIQVHYALTADSSNIAMIQVTPNTTSLLVSGLKSFRTYTFWVTCVTRIGAGNPSDGIRVRTLEELVPLELTVRFPSLRWNSNLSLPDSQDFKELCDYIKNNVFQMYGQNETQLRNVGCLQFRNGSVIADLTIVYGQYVDMTHFARIFKALYVDGRLYNISVQPLSDNVPGKPPVNVSATTITSTSILVTWLCSDCDTSNSTIAFLVTYRSRDSNNTNSVTVNSTMRSVTLSGLEKFTLYEILVTSVTIRGAGVSLTSVYNRTFQDRPRQAPSSIQAFNTSSTSLRVIWGEVPFGSIHGILQGYVINFKKLNDLASKWTSITVGANISNTSIASLDKFTHYIIEIKAFTVVGWGPSRNTSATTDEDVPSHPPTAIKARNVSSTAIEVTWSQVPSGFENGIVIGYHALYRRANDSNATYVMVTTHALSNLTLYIVKLNKYTDYRIKMMAFTRKGNGTESQETSVYTDEDTPSRAPLNLHGFNTSSTSLNVSWDPIFPQYFVHGILRGYRVLYKRVYDVSSYGNLTTLNNDYVITGLEKYTEYSIKVLAFTSKGDGVASVTVNVSTDEDVPSLSPRILNGHNTSSTSLYLSWNPVPHGFVHGILLGYKVLYKIDYDGSLNYTFTLTTNTTRVAVLDGLVKFTTYMITVLAFTRKGDGPMADNLTVTTDEDIPSLSPTNLKACNTSSTSLLINWGPVPDGHVHGILRGYRVMYKISDDINGSFSNITSASQSVNLTRLKKYTVYMLKVLAFTIKGDGPLTNSISISTDEDVPNRSPTNVRSHNTSATSLNVTWLDIPSGFVHGILLGYRVLYWIKERRSERSVDGNRMIKTVISPNIYTVVLMSLENFTEYNIQVLGYTRIGDGKESMAIQATTDENVPGEPPANLEGNNASSTSIQVYWDSVPTGFVYGILRGYRLMYKVKTDRAYVIRTLNRNTKNELLSGLYKYTYYDIKILAFTRIGDGVESKVIAVQTDEDIPSKAPSNVYTSDRVSSTAIPITWTHIPRPFVHGRLRGYHIKYKIIELADNKVDQQSYRSVRVGPRQTNVTLINLESYATYEIQIAGFTVKGDGVWKTFYGRTCKCHPILPANWFDHPPYVKDDIFPGVNDSGNVDAHVHGIFPPILHAAVKLCCGKCAVESPLDLRKKGYKKEGLIQVKDNIDDKNYINFPIGGIKGQTSYQGHQGVFEFVSIMDMPGAAFLVADRRKISTEVIFAIFACWPTVAFVFVAAFLAGAAIWLIDVRFNPQHFPQSFLSGSWEGMWWSFITMTTVGYGDRIPKSVPARLFSVVWIWMGIATIAVLTSSITASLMSMVFKTEIKLYGAKVAAIDNSSEYKLGVRRNAKLDVGRKYGNITEIFEDLDREKVHAALLDSYATASQKELFDKKWLRVRDIIKTGFDSTYGVVLSGDSMKLGRCMRDYMKAESSKISRLVQSNVESITASKVPPAIKRSSDLLTAESDLFKLTCKILGGMLAILVCLSLIWEYYRRRKIKKIQKRNNENKDLEKNWPFWANLPAIQRYEMTKSQYRQDFENFYQSFRQAYEILRKKHSRQIKEFKSQNKVGIHHFSVSEWTGGRSATYAVTQDGDVNSILDGLDMSMFDGKHVDRNTKQLGL